MVTEKGGQRAVTMTRFTASRNRQLSIHTTYSIMNSIIIELKISQKQSETYFEQRGAKFGQTMEHRRQQNLTRRS